MTYKWIGAMCIVLACGGFGITLAAAQRREERELSNLIRALDYMTCELQYRLTPLPELCRQAGKEGSGLTKRIFLGLAEELESQISPDVACCMAGVLARTEQIPERIFRILKELGGSMGRFDLAGQLKGLAAIRDKCRREMELLAHNRESRHRSYQTLGFCAGAAIAILFL